MNENTITPINILQPLNNSTFTVYPLHSNTAEDQSKSLEHRLNNLLTHNNHLQEENIKYHTKIIKLESQLKEKCDQNYHTQHHNNNTSYNFYLPSEIQVMWQNLALGFIGDCYMELFPYPHITFHLIQEMFFIMIQMIKEKMRTIINTFLSQCNMGMDIGQDQKEYQENFDNLYNDIRPFIQQNVKNVFENDKMFNQVFKRNYMRFYNCEIRPMIEMYEELNIVGMAKEIDKIIQSKSFEIMIETIKKIVIFIELNDQKLQFNIKEYSIREMKMMNRENSLKEKDVLNVLGKGANDWEMMIVLIQPPLMKNGFSYRGLMPIVLTCDNMSYITTNGNGGNDNNNKGTNISSRMSIRSISNNNIYNYNCTSEDREDIYMNGDDDNEGEIDTEGGMTINSPKNYLIETDYNHLDKVKTQRYTNNKDQTINSIYNNGNYNTMGNNTIANYNNDHNHTNASKVSNGSYSNGNSHINGNNVNNTITNTFIGKGMHSHTRSLPKSTIEQEIYYEQFNNNTNAGKQINLSKKNPKVYKIKRQGKSIQLQEMKDSCPITKRWWDSPSIIHTRQKYIGMKLKSSNQLKKCCVDGVKGITDFSTSNSIIDTCGNIINNNKKKYIHNSRGNSKGSVDACYVQTTTTNGNAQGKKSNSRPKHTTTKMMNKNNNKSIEKQQNKYNYKTCAATKVNVNELLSFKHKNKGKIIKEFTGTFTSHHHYCNHQANNDMKL